MPLTKLKDSNLEASAVTTHVDSTGIEDDVALLGFRVASNGSLAKYNLAAQTIDDFQISFG